MVVLHQRDVHHILEKLVMVDPSTKRWVCQLFSHQFIFPTIYLTVPSIWNFLLIANSLSSINSFSLMASTPSQAPHGPLALMQRHGWLFPTCHKEKPLMITYQRLNNESHDKIHSHPPIDHQAIQDPTFLLFTVNSINSTRAF